jgi:transcription termination factor Rho
MEEESMERVPTGVAAAPSPRVPELPERVHLDELHSMPFSALCENALKYHIRFSTDRSRHYLVLDTVRFYLSKGVPVFVEGVLEMENESFGFLRWPRYSFKHLPQDAHVSTALIRQHFLRNGQRIQARVRLPREREKSLAVDSVLAIEGMPPEQWCEPKHFDQLTAMFPNERIILENQVTKSVAARAIDLITPLGRGQRALIVAPPRVGKTILLKEIAKAIRATNPQTHLIMLLVDERPEEVTDFTREVDAEIYSSTFDENATRHVQLCDLVIDRAKRLLELKQHIVILLDSLTRLARGYNNIQPGKGRLMSGGVETKALLKPKKFFGAARNVEEGGSLTIIATALTETQSRADDLIFEEFKGTGNMELHLDRSLAERRIFPAIHVLQSGTRREEQLYHPREFEKIQVLRKQLASMPPGEAMEVLLKAIRSTRSNTELLLTGLR